MTGLAQGCRRGHRDQTPAIWGTPAGHQTNVVVTAARGPTRQNLCAGYEVSDIWLSIWTGIDPYPAPVHIVPVVNPQVIAKSSVTQSTFTVLFWAPFHVQPTWRLDLAGFSNRGACHRPAWKTPALDRGASSAAPPPPGRAGSAGAATGRA